MSRTTTLPDPMFRRFTEDLQSRLQAMANPKTRAWWDAYMKGEADFRGVGIPAIRTAVAAWRRDLGIDGWPADRQSDLALALMAEAMTEDKLAGMLLIQVHLAPALDGPKMLPSYARLLRDGCLADWNSVDWFCVRVIGPLIARQGEAAADVVAGWTAAPGLWQARAGLVGFVPVAKDRRWHAHIERGAERLVARPERFAKTAVGWLLRDMASVDRPRVEAFLTRWLPSFSTEAMNNVTKHFPIESKHMWRKRFRDNAN